MKTAAGVPPNHNTQSREEINNTCFQKLVGKIEEK